MKTPFSILFLFFSAFCSGQILPEIDLLIKKEMESNIIPALAVAVIDSGTVVHLSANGYRDLDKKEEVTINTPFQIASVSKTVTNLAVFKLVESKKIDLHSDINKYLPFEIKNPYYPREKITVKELLNHRSGIRDDHEIYDPFWTKPNGDSKIKLADFLKDYLSENGKLYKKEHFESSVDYKSYSYSNTGFALLGLIIETVSNSSFEEFCQQKIFKPLAMENTSWFLKNLGSNEVAKPYSFNDTNKLHFDGHNGYPDYPAGQLRTSISDFSKLITGYLKSESSEFILSKKTINQITPVPRISQEGYFTWFMGAMGNKLYYWHGGGDPGVRTGVIIDVTNKNGIAIFANSEYNFKNLLENIEEKMWGN